MKKIITFILIATMLIIISGCGTKERPTDISEKAYNFAVAFLDTTHSYYEGLNSASGVLLLMEDEYDDFMNTTDPSFTYTQIMLKFIYMKQAVEKDNREDFRKMYDEVKEILAIEE